MLQKFVLAVFLHGIVATYLIPQTDKQRVWWSKYAADTRPIPFQNNNKIQPLQSTDGYHPRYSESGNSQGYYGQNSGSRSFQQLEGSTGSRFDKASQNKGANSWGDYQYQDTGSNSWGQGKGANSWGKKQGQNKGKNTVYGNDYQYQDYGVNTWTDKQFAKNPSADKGKTSWTDNQNSNKGKNSWGNNKQYQDKNSQFWGQGQTDNKGSNVQYQNKGVNSRTTEQYRNKGGNVWSGYHYQDAGTNSWGKDKGSNNWYDNQYQDTWGDKDYQDTYSSTWGDDQYDDAVSGKAYGKGESSCVCDGSMLERVQDLEKKVHEMFMQKDQLTNKVYDVMGSVGSSNQRQIVSFSAQASKNLPYLEESEIIIFDEVLVNNGGAYDPHSGIFFAPVPGVYMFSATVLSGFNATIETAITLNSKEASRLYSGGHGNRGSGSNTVILNLRKGDEVAVAVFFKNGNYVHGKWSTFTGGLLETY